MMNKENQIKDVIPDLEAIPLVTIYKRDGNIGIKYNQDDVKKYEIYGFLRIYLSILEDQLLDEQSEDIVE